VIFCITPVSHPHSGWFFDSHALRVNQAKANNKKKNGF